MHDAEKEEMPMKLNIIVTSLPHVMACQKAAIFLADDTGQTASLAASFNLSADCF